MKLHKKILFAAGMFSLLWIAGCREIEVKTTVNRDGSLERTVSVKGDSSSLLDSKFPLPGKENAWTVRRSEGQPVPADSVWTIRIEKEESGSRYQYRAERRFRNAGEMNRFFDPDTGMAIRLEAGVKKRFRGFSTFIEYHETIRSQNPFTLVPYTDFLTEEELRLYLSDQVTDEREEELEKKLEDWGNRAVFEEFYRDLLPAAMETGRPDEMRALVESKKEKLYAATQDMIEKDGENMVSQAMRTVCEALGNEAAEELEPAVARSLERIGNKIAFLGADIGDSYLFSVTMPGLIVDTNSESIEGNRVSWKVENEDFMLTDYEMRVESRVVNRTMIVITMIAAFMLLVVILAGALRRKRT